MRVRGDAPVLWRTTGQTQIGVEPGRSLVLTGLTTAEQQLLDHLPRRMSPDDVYRASRRCRVPLPRAQDLLERLRAEGVLRGGDSRPTTPEEQYWERLVRSPRSRATRLRAKRVALFGSGPLAHELAALLAEAGLGAILPEDEAVGAQIVARFPGTDTGAPLDTIPDLTLTLEPHVIDPLRARALTQAGARHLPVTLREVSVRVGPLFEPDRPVCHDCLDLWETDADACWPAIATQARLLPEPVLERLLLHQCAALAVRAALDLHPNSIVYRQGEFILAQSYRLTGTGGAQASQEVVMDFLKRVNAAASAHGILPDPIRGTVGVIDGEQMYGIMQTLEPLYGMILLSAYARDDTDALGPLRLNIKVERAAE